MIKGKKILVTGGAGFIGGHLVNELIILKAEVYVVDIIINPKSIFSLKNLKEKVKLSIIDIRNREKIISYIN